MKNKLLLFLLFANISAFAQWTNLNTGINDNLSSIVFHGQIGIVSGAHGIYYTTTGGNGAASWTRFHVTGSTANSAIYENTNFKYCTDFGNNYEVFACGQNTATQRAVIMRINCQNGSSSLIYYGEPNSSLNRIQYVNVGDGQSNFAVGDNGLVVKFGPFVTTAVVPTGLTDNLISFTGSMIGAADKIIVMTSDFSNNDNLIFTPIPTPGLTNKDLYYINPDYIYSVGSDYATVNRVVNTVTRNNEFDYGALNASCIAYKPGYHFVGTDHGIFASDSQYSVLEYQPSSGTNAINDIFALGGVSEIYACGNNGLLLKSTNFGGPIQPYARLNFSGNCVNDTTLFNSIIGESNNCTYTLDGVPFHTGCSSFSNTFTVAGNHTLSLTVTNSFGLTKTVSQPFNITAKPGINKTVTVADAILCHEEPLQLQIANSETDVVYILKKQGDDVNIEHGTSTPGNGGTLNFTTDPVSSTGTYYLIAKNINGCRSTFTTTFNVQVEQTTSEFHSSLINALTGETVKFYQYGTEAQSFNWTFPAGASSASSALDNPQNSFSVPDNNSVSLLVTSPNNCQDDVQHDVFVYETPAVPDNCWSMVYKDEDISDGFIADREVFSMSMTADGFVTTGNYLDMTVDSTVGTKKTLGDGGGYVAKHDRNGVLKWVVKSIRTGPSYLDLIKSSAVDQQGNIYITGNASQGWIYDNTGAKVIMNASGNAGFLMKLNSEGKVLWYTKGIAPLKVWIDKANNPVVTIVTANAAGGSPTGDIQVYLNNTATTIIHQPIGQTDESVYAVVKFSPTGTVLWNAAISTEDINNQTDIVDLGFDASNNIYVTGNYEMSAKFYSAGNITTAVALNTFGDYGNKLFHVKYNANGILQWKTSSLCVGIGDNVNGSDAVTDDLGNTYITGENALFTATGNQVFANANGTTTQEHVGTYFIAKVNASGICEWIKGNRNDQFSIGYKVLQSGNEITVAGQLSSIVSVPIQFISADNQNYNLSIGSGNYWLATYDPNGNLQRIVVNDDVPDNAHTYRVSGLFKEGASYYMAKNLSVYDGQTYNDFGSSITTNGVDAVITRFTESCGIVKYNRALGVDTPEGLAQMTVAPNPTSGKFTIHFNSLKANANIEISDITGKIIAKQTVQNSSQFNGLLTGSSGMYFVKVTAGNSVQWFKVIKR